MKPEQRAREIRAEIAKLDADYVQQRATLTSELTMLRIHYGSAIDPGMPAPSASRSRRASAAESSVPTTGAAKPARRRKSRRTNGRKSRQARRGVRQLTHPKYADKRTEVLNVQRLTKPIQEQLTACFKSGMTASEARKTMLAEQKLRIPAPRVGQFWRKLKAQAQA